MTPNTLQTWHPWQRTALLLLALLVGAVGGTRWADAQVASALRPDLQADFDDWDSFPMDGMWTNVRVTFFVHNVGSIPEWDPELKRWVGSRLGGPADKVVALFSLQDWLTFVSAAADSNFTCAHSGGVVTCSGGSIANTKTATIILTLTVPPEEQGRCSLRRIDMVVDPWESIDERDETNNAATKEVEWMGCIG